MFQPGQKPSCLRCILFPGHYTGFNHFYHPFARWCDVLSNTASDVEPYLEAPVVDTQEDRFGRLTEREALMANPYSFGIQEMGI